MTYSWRTKKLSEVCEKITDGTHQTPTYFSEGHLFLSSRNVTSGTIDWENVKYIDLKQHVEMQRRVSPRLNDILLAKNGTTGVAAIVDRDLNFDIYVSLALLRPMTEVLPSYLLHFINSPAAKSQFTKRLKGIGVPNLHLKEIREVEIPFPESKAEQQRIVGILDEAFDGIATAKANAERNLQNAQTIFESYLESVFTKHGNGWAEERLGDHAEFKNGLNFTRQSRGQTLRIIGVGDFHDNLMVSTANLQSVTIDGKLSDDYLIRRDDILMVRSNGSRNLVGRCMLVPNVDETISYSGFIIRLRFDTRKISPRFLLRFIKSSRTRERLTQDGGGANISNINQAKLSELPILLPPLKDQETIANRLDEISSETQRLAALCQSKLDALNALKKSLLNQAFSGQL